MPKLHQAIALDERAADIPSEDQRLAARCMNGDPEALHRLWTEHHRMVRRLLCFVVSADPSVDDLVQDVFVRALEVLPTYRGQASLAVWLRGIALNVARTRRDKSRRRRRLFARFASEAPTPAVTPEVVLHDRSALRRLDALLERLPAAEREAFVLRRIERVPEDEAAALAAVPSSTLGDRARRAERKLREWMEE